jgi:hypothetical protein
MCVELCLHSSISLHGVALNYARGQLYYHVGGRGDAWLAPLPPAGAK